MGRVNSFTFITLNGFYKDAFGDIAWHSHNEKATAYSTAQLASGNLLLFGRITYDMMAAFWQSEQAWNSFPEVAEGMNRADKLVVSTSKSINTWSNTSKLEGELTVEVSRLKRELERDITVLGSGSIVAQLAEAGLIDEFQILTDPVVIPDGTPLFTGIKRNLKLLLTGTEDFGNGSLLHHFRPIE
ncbi:dihydrofolate reductase family protein [Robertkochia solimangrovi]|uniref:dihydrofolate reductase family protein n=1 Tax=Robertkochia solimangrovi TaxID=2213046 RepID=UPI00117D38DF|nr:dihydrofolate reductase family protein [Robertkochia solimangrovi]TRZ41270.1 dihydrofolate reductase [Robertkochia solimangrovi]